MHGKNLIHRDLKPDNIIMGLGDTSNIVHIVDFGLTRPIIDHRTGAHIPFTTNKNMIGTCRYVSFNSHLGYEVSRRDDLISLCYIAVNFYKGELPWQRIQLNKNSPRYSNVGKVKKEHSGEKLCKGCPK